MAISPRAEGYANVNELDVYITGEPEEEIIPHLTLVESETEEVLLVDDRSTEPLEQYRGDWEKASAARTNQAAFEALYHEYAGFIRFKAMPYFLPGADKQDLLQEATIGFYKGVRDYDGQKSSLRNFVELCITRQIITAVKIATRKKHSLLNDARSFASTPPGLETNPEATLELTLPDDTPPLVDIVVGREVFKDLLSMINTQLSILERDVLSMHMDGHTYETIAQNLGIDEKCVDNAVQRARSKTRRYLKERDE